jgi:hypothetical protein
MLAGNAITWLAGDPSAYSGWGGLSGFGKGLPSIPGAYMRGAFSSILPIDMMTEAEKEALRKNITGSGKGLLDPITSRIPSGVKKAGGLALRTAGRLMGPVMTSYRLATETSGRGVGGGIWKGGRIIGEEMAWGGGMAAGMALGGAVTAGIAGAKIGGTIGAAAGPIGIGIGIVAGMAIGAAGAYTINKVFDAAEVPFRMAKAGWNFLRETGRNATKLELGGQVSRANRNRLSYTMRQRSLAQINRSGINARSVLGNEAQYFHIR